MTDIKRFPEELIQRETEVPAEDLLEEIPHPRETTIHPIQIVVPINVRWLESVPMIQVREISLILLAEIKDLIQKDLIKPVDPMAQNPVPGTVHPNENLVRRKYPQEETKVHLL